MADFEKCSLALQKGQAKEVVAIVEEAIAEGIEAKTILEEGLMSGMNIIGVKFKNNEVYVPEVLIAARAMNMGAALLKPLLLEAGVESKGKAVLGTVKGDLHDIGKNLVVMMLKGSGFEVDDLGVDCRIEDYEAAVGRGAEVVCLSALLSTTREAMRPVADYFSARDEVKLVVGGAGVTQEFADEIGADGFGVDASDAVRVVRECLGLAAMETPV